MLVQRESHNVKLAIAIEEPFSDRFDEADIKLFKSEAGPDNIVAAFSKSPHRFNLVVLPRAGVGHLMPGGLLNYAKEAGKFEHDSTAINCIYATNVSTQENFIPFNGWIAAHRLFHCFLLGRTNDGNEKAFNDVTAQAVSRLREYVGFVKFPQQPYQIGMTDYEYWFTKYILTMRSARMDNIRNPADPFAEVGAQHIVTGGIKLLRANDMAARIDLLARHTTRMGEHFNYKSIPSPSYYIRAMVMKVLESNPALFDEVVEQLEQQYTEIITTSLDSVVGTKTLIF